MEGSNLSTHDTSTRHRDSAAELAALKAQIEELQKQLATIDAILVADEKTTGRKTPANN
jgi:prefoldin subunit 5